MRVVIVVSSLIFSFYAQGGVKLESLNEKYKKIKENLVVEEDLQRKLMGRLYKINNNLKKMSKTREELTNKYLATNRNVKHVAREIIRLEKKIKSKKKFLTKKLRFIFLMKKHGIMQFLFSSTSSHDLDKHIKYLKLFSESDLRTIEEFRLVQDSLNRQRKKMREAVKKMMIAREVLNKQKKKLAREQKMKTKWIKTIRSNKKKYISHIKVLRRISNHTKSNVKDLLKISFFEKKGKLMPPLGFSLERKYGYIEDPKYYFQLSHKGLFFRATESKTIRAVHEGKVAYVGKIKGYGKTLIIDHGDHYYTLYGSLSNITVKRGETVSSQKVIAKPGTSSLYKLGFYFEIRHFSDAIDPLSWFDKSQRLSSVDLGVSHF